MKRVFLLSLGLLLGMAGFAQVKSVNEAAKQSVLTHQSVMRGTEVLPAANFKPSVLPSVASSFTRDDLQFEDYTTMVTNYDLQSNALVCNRIAAWADGTVAVTETWDNTGTTSFSGRGTGYNFYDGGDFGDMPEVRQEPAKSGWPSICAYGDGEVLASHNTGVNVYYRPTKGTGEWTLMANLQTSDRAWTWPRLACTADGTLHLIVCDQFADSQSHNISEIAYYRSTDGAATWTRVENAVIDGLNNDYLNQVSADDYMLAVKGNTIVLACFGITYDIFYCISEDAGQTWEKKIVAQFPLGQFDWAQTAVSAETDSIWWSDGTGSVAIDNDGTIHMAWALGRWAPAPDSGWGYLSYWPVTLGIMYWNSNYVNPVDGSNQIPVFGSWSGDNNPAWTANGTNGRSSMMNDDRLMALAEEEGNHNIHFFGYNSEAEPENENGLWGTMTSEMLDNRWGVYKSYGIATHPNIAIDNNGTIYVIYTSYTDLRTSTQNAAGLEFYLRSAFLHTCVDGVWQLPYEAYSLSADFVHSDDEVYPTFCYPEEVNGEMWFAYSADDQQGCYLNDYDSDNNGQKDLSDNYLWVVKMTKLDEVSEVKDVVYNIFPNPASDYICISVEANVNATITFTNLAGQTVKSFNKALTLGENSISLDLESGVYFMTVNANGFNKTTKVVVK